jgi:hypothetical protein
VTADDDPRAEARAFGRYLVGTEPTPAEVDRYAAAVAARIARAPDAVVRAARAVPALVGPLDAAAAFVDPEHQLRQRLLVLLAILEASPEHAERFLPRDWPFAAIAALGVRLVVLVPLRLLIGVPALLALKLLRA